MEDSIGSSRTCHGETCAAYLLVDAKGEYRSDEGLTAARYVLITSEEGCSCPIVGIKAYIYLTVFYGGYASRLNGFATSKSSGYPIQNRRRT